MTKIKNNEPSRHHDGRWMYTDAQLLNIVKIMSDAKRANLYEKVIDIMENDNRPKIYAIAKLLGCSYDDAGFWATKKKIKTTFSEKQLQKVEYDPATPHGVSI